MGSDEGQTLSSREPLRLCDDPGLAQYAFFMEMDEEDAGVAGCSALADVRGRSEIDPRDLDADPSCPPASLVMLPRIVNEGTCPYLQTAAEAQSILKSDRAQVSSIDCSQQSTVQDLVAPRGPLRSPDASRRSEDDEMAWAKSALHDWKHFKRAAVTEYCIKNSPTASSLELTQSFEGHYSKEPTVVSEREQELALLRKLVRQRASGVRFSLSGGKLFLGSRELRRP
jgi:hypothetical protein